MTTRYLIVDPLNCSNHTCCYYRVCCCCYRTFPPFFLKLPPCSPSLVYDSASAGLFIIATRRTYVNVCRNVTNAGDRICAKVNKRRAQHVIASCNALQQPAAVHLSSVHICCSPDMAAFLHLLLHLSTDLFVRNYRGASPVRNEGIYY